MRTTPTRILVFDCECRPTAWISGDFVGRSLTAVAWQFLDEDTNNCRVLTRSMKSVKPLLNDFLKAYDEADIVVGHYIRGFDLPLVNGDLERLGLAPLEDKLTVDTKLDRSSTLGLSESLGNLVARYEIEHEKVPMTEPMWEEHNLWQTNRSVQWVADRVVGDVESTIDLYLTLVLDNRIKGSKLWSPRQSKMPRYRA